MDKIYRMIKFILILIPILAFVFLLNKKFATSFTADYDFSYKYHPFISTLKPTDRLGNIEKDKNGKFYQSINNEPIYFDIETPRGFKELDLEIEYKNTNQDDFKVGILVDKKNWQYKLKPVENNKMNKLIEEWNSIQKENIILLQRNKKFDSIDDFLENLPNKKEIAAYNYDLKDNFKIKKYQPNDKIFEFSKPICGYHQFYTYIKNEVLNFSFIFDYRKKQKDSENNNLDMINIYYKDKPVEHKEIYTDVKIMNEVKFYKPNLPEGVYKIELKVSDDICIKKILTTQQFLTFINKIHLAADNNFNKEIVYTNAPSIKAATLEGKALQDIEIGKVKLKIDDIYKQFTAENYRCDDFSNQGHDYCLTEIRLSKNNLLIQGAGLFSFTKESFLSPGIESLEHITRIDNINYIIANYNLPVIDEKGWKTAYISFDISNIERDYQKYNFILSVLGMKGGEPIYISKIKAKFRN